MANDRVIAIRITADGKVALAELDKVENKLGKQPGTMEKLKASWMGVTVAVAAAAVAMKQAWDLADRAATYWEQIAALNSLGKQYGQTGEQITQSVKEAARGLVSLADAADMSAKALNLGLNPQQVVEFTRVSEQLTDVIGGTVPQAFERMTIAAASGRTMTLAQMGIMVDLDRAYKNHAAAQGRNVTSLSETEKHQIRLNAILDAAKQKMNVLGPATDTVKDKMDRLRMQIDDLKLSVGSFVIKAGLALYGLFQGAAAAALTLYAGILKLAQGYEVLMSKISLSKIVRMEATANAEAFKAQATAAWDAAQDLAKKGNENLAAIFKSSAEVMGAMESAGGGAPAEDSAAKAKKYSNAARLQMEVEYMQAVKALWQTQGILTIQEQHAMDLQIFDTAAAAKIQALQEQLATEQELKDANAVLNKQRQTLEAEQHIREEQRKLDSTRQTAANFAQVGQLMSSMGGANARKWFSLQKNASIAEAIINTYTGATKALSQGGVYGAVLAASVIALGMAQVAKIRAQTFDGGGSGGAVGTFSANPTTGLPDMSGAGGRDGVGDTYIIMQDNRGQETGRYKYDITKAVLETLSENNGTVGGYSVRVENHA